MNDEIKKENSQVIAIDLSCRFCGTKCGTLEVPIERVAGKAITQESLGIVDVRCDKCEGEHGNYKEMSNFFMQTIDDTADEFNEHMKQCEFKMDGFVNRMAAARPQRLFAAGEMHEAQHPEIRKRRILWEAELGITELESDEKVELVRLAPSFGKAEVAVAKEKIIKRRK